MSLFKDFPFDIESSFFANSEKALGLCHHSGSIFELLTAFKEKRWKAVLDISNSILNSDVSVVVRSFAFHYKMCALDIKYDPNARERALRDFLSIKGWADCEYSKFIKIYQSALADFFSVRLREAQSKLMRALQLTLDYPLGKIRVLVHLGLISRDLDESQQSLNYFDQAILIATENNYAFIMSRLLAQKEENSSLSQIEEAFLKRDAKVMREVLLKSENMRRQRKINRKRQSLYVFLPLLWLLRGNHTKSEKLIKRIDDPILKLKIYHLKKNVFSLTKDEFAEVEMIQFEVGINQILKSEILGVELNRIKNLDLRNLLVLFIESIEPVTKEDIAQKILGLNYDPVMHDKRIYRLIYDAKALIGRNDLFVNLYGKYQINPKYLGKQDMLGSKSA